MELGQQVVRVTFFVTSIVLLLSRPAYATLDAKGVQKLTAAFNKNSALVTGTRRILSGKILEQQSQGELTQTLHRDDEIQQILDIAVRTSRNTSLLIGKTGVGSSSVANTVAEKIVTGDLPAGIHSQYFDRALVIETTPAQILGLMSLNGGTGASAVSMYFSALSKFEIDQHCSIFLILEKTNQFTESQIAGFESLLNNHQKLVSMLWLATSRPKFVAANSSVLSMLKEIPLLELTRAQAVDVVNQQLPKIEAYYHTSVPRGVVKTAVEVAPLAMGGMSLPNSATQFLEDAVINAEREHPGENKAISKMDLFRMAAKNAGMKFVPQDRENFLRFMDEGKTWAKTQVKGNDRAVDKIFDLATDMLTERGAKKTRSAAIVGGTGSGKSMIVKLLATWLWGDTKRVLDLDMNKLKDERQGRNLLFGPDPGYIGFGTSPGMLPKFYDGDGKMFSIVDAAELDKAHPDNVELLMELLDTGHFTGNDGEVREVGYSLFLFSANQGAETLLPPDFLRNATQAQLDEKIESTTEAQIKEAFLRPDKPSKDHEGLKPEVVERFDAFILQAPVLKKTAIEITANAVRDKARSIEDDDLGRITTDDKFAVAFNESHDPAYGVRNVKRVAPKFLKKLSDEHLKKYGKSESLVVKTIDPPPGKESYYFTISNERGETLQMEGPKRAYRNPLLNPVLKANLQTVESFLNSKVFGQTHAIKAIAEAVLGRALDVDSEQPLFLFLAGLTGTGKSELGKQLAIKLFGSKSFFTVFNMGKILSRYDMTVFFEGEPNTNKVGEFELMLQRSDRGVSLLDELSNVGGSDKKVKEDFVKILYDLKEEGSWTSPKTGKKYPLAKWIFEATGNDGEKLFSKVSSPDMMHAVWNLNQNRLEEILGPEGAGFPDAFLGRFEVLTLMEPPSAESKAEVAGKFLDEWKVATEANQPVKIHLDPNFGSELARLTFTKRAGARDHALYDPQIKELNHKRSV